MVNFVGLLSMTVGFAALGVAIIIAHRQGKQTKKIASVTDEIHEMAKELNSATKEIHEVAKEQKRLNDDARSSYANAFVNYIGSISKQYERVIITYENRFKGKPNNEEKNIARERLKQYYNNMLIRDFEKFKQNESVKIFGKRIADKHWEHTKRMSSYMLDTFDDNEIKSMMKNFIVQMQKLVELKDIFLQYCEESVKNKDLEYQKNYELIKEDYEFIKKNMI